MNVQDYVYSGLAEARELLELLNRNAGGLKRERLASVSSVKANGNRAEAKIPCKLKRG